MVRETDVAIQLAAMRVGLRALLPPGPREEVPDDKLVEALGIILRDLQEEQNEWRDCVEGALGIEPLSMTDDVMRTTISAVVSDTPQLVRDNEREMVVAYLREWAKNVKRTENFPDWGEVFEEALEVAADHIEAGEHESWREEQQRKCEAELREALQGHCRDVGGAERRGP